MTAEFNIGDHVQKHGGRYGGPGEIVGETKDLDGAGYKLWNVAMKIEGGYGRFVHVFPSSVLSHASSRTIEPSFQGRVGRWMDACFTVDVIYDMAERSHRFLEEALELVQAIGCTQSEAHQLVDYVFGRQVGDPKQEVGGVRVTLSALCNAAVINERACAEEELTRIWGMVERIRAKHASKPKFSPLPGV